VFWEIILGIAGRSEKTLRDRQREERGTKKILGITELEPYNVLAVTSN
jgi:hypothetical protein